MELSKELAIGIDIGGTNTKWGLVNHRGEIVQKGELKTDDFLTIESFIEALYQTLAPVIDEAGKDKILKGMGL